MTMKKTPMRENERRRKLNELTRTAREQDEAHEARMRID